MTSGPQHLPLILLVEDNPGDQFLTRKALRDSGAPHHLDIVEDGDAALDYMHRRGNYAGALRPDLVLLDLNLPKVSGIEVLSVAKEHPEIRTIPIIVLTSSEAETDLIASYTRHANAYMVKPGSPTRFRDAIEALGRFWFMHSKLVSR